VQGELRKTRTATQLRGEASGSILKGLGKTALGEGEELVMCQQLYLGFQ
jgi:hypothetical protein